MGQCTSCGRKDVEVQGHHAEDEELAKAFPPTKAAEAPLPTKELYLAGVKAGAASLKLKDKLLLAQALVGGREDRGIRFGYERSTRPWSQGAVQGLGPCSSQGQGASNTGDATPTGTAVSSIHAHSHTSLLVIESRPISPAASDRGQGHDYSRAASGLAAAQGSRLPDSLRRVNSLGGGGGRERNGCKDSRSLDDAAAVLAVTKALQIAPLAAPGLGRRPGPQQQQRRGSIQTFPGTSSPSRQPGALIKASVEEGTSGGTSEFGLLFATGVSPSLEAPSRPQPSPLGVQRLPDALRNSSPSSPSPRQPRLQQQHHVPMALRQQQHPPQAEYQRACTSRAKADSGYMPPATQCTAAGMRPGGESCDDIARLDGGEAGPPLCLTAVPRFHSQSVPPAAFLASGGCGAAAAAAANAAADLTEPSPAGADPVTQFDAASVAQVGVCASPPPAGSGAGSITEPGPPRKFLPKWTDQMRPNVDLTAQPKRPALKSSGSAVGNALLSDSSAGNAAIGNTAIDTTLVDTTLVGNTLVDTTLVDTTLVDTTLVGNTAIDAIPVSRLSPSQCTALVLPPYPPAGRHQHPLQSPAPPPPPQTCPMDWLLPLDPLQGATKAVGSYRCRTDGPNASAVPVSQDAVMPFGGGHQQQLRKQQWDLQPQHSGSQL